VLEGLGDPARLTIVDAGAGTGISAQLLSERGARVIALEPNDDMRSEAAASGLEVHNARADATHLPDNFADVVTAFQAFHWFGTDATLAEFRRILRPGGRIAIVWNQRDDNDPFAAGYGEIFDKRRQEEIAKTFSFNWTGVEAQLRDAGLRNARTLYFSIAQELDREALLGRARSASYVPASGPQHDAIMRDLNCLHERYADALGFVILKYRTEVYLAEAPD